MHDPASEFSESKAREVWLKQLEARVSEYNENVAMLRNAQKTKLQALEAKMKIKFEAMSEMKRTSFAQVDIKRSSSAEGGKGSPGKGGGMGKGNGRGARAARAAPGRAAAWVRETARVHGRQGQLRVREGRRHDHGLQTEGDGKE